MKIIRLALLAVAAGAACLRPPHPAGDAELQVEIIAIRDVLRQYSPALLTIDRGYAEAGHAPPPATGQLRPAERHRALVNTLRGGTLNPRGDSLRVRVSAPQVRGKTATSDVTVDGRLAGGHPGAFYETVALVLERAGERWVVRKRTQLGIS